jgi:hypothetical protein
MWKQERRLSAESCLENEIMSKYEALKFLKETKARIPHVCDRCGEEIEKGETYYPESTGRVKALGIRLRKFCKECYQTRGEKLLAESRDAKEEA